jgi:hypothetical protein
MGPYQAAMVISGMIFPYSILFCCYYLLPLDEERHKYLPGEKNRCITECCIKFFVCIKFFPFA